MKQKSTKLQQKNRKRFGYLSKIKLTLLAMTTLAVIIVAISPEESNLNKPLTDSITTEYSDHVVKNRRR